MTAAEQIKLAEALGWTPLTGKRVGWWMPPGVPESTQCWVSANELPDPETDANDCEALIQWLTECDSGYQVEVTFNFSSIGHFVKLRSVAAGTVGEWQGEDWKQGVCELALKVIEPLPDKYGSGAMGQSL